MELAIGGGTPGPLVSMAPSGYELVIKGEDGSKILGSRELARYYKQCPKPSDTRDVGLRNALVARYVKSGEVVWIQHILVTAAAYGGGTSCSHPMYTFCG